MKNKIENIVAECAITFVFGLLILASLLSLYMILIMLFYWWKEFLGVIIIAIVCRWGLLKYLKCNSFIQLLKHDRF